MSNVMVLRVKDNEVDTVKAFYEHFGLKFVEEQHGNGPRHWACEYNGMVLEVYPQGNKPLGIQFY